MNGDVRYVLTTEVRGSDTRRLQMVDSACSYNRREAEGGGGAERGGADRPHSHAPTDRENPQRVVSESAVSCPQYRVRAGSREPKPVGVAQVRPIPIGRVRLSLRGGSRPLVSETG